MLKIYFAHPAFTDSQKAFRSAFLPMLTNIEDARVYDPFAYSPAIEGDREAKKKLGKSVLKVNEDLINHSDLLIALIDDKDQGTIFEMGYAHARGVPIITVSAHDYDVNIMLAESVLAHFPNVLENNQNLVNIIKALTKVTLVKNE